MRRKITNHAEILGSIMRKKANYAENYAGFHSLNRPPFCFFFKILSCSLFSMCILSIFNTINGSFHGKITS